MDLEELRALLEFGHGIPRHELGESDIVCNVAEVGSYFQGTIRMQFQGKLLEITGDLGKNSTEAESKAVGQAITYFQGNASKKATESSAPSPAATPEDVANASGPRPPGKRPREKRRPQWEALLEALPALVGREVEAPDDYEMVVEQYEVGFQATLSLTCLGDVVFDSEVGDSSWSSQESVASMALAYCFERLGACDQPREEESFETAGLDEHASKIGEDEISSKRQKVGVAETKVESVISPKLEITNSEMRNKAANQAPPDKAPPRLRMPTTKRQDLVKSEESEPTSGFRGTKVEAESSRPALPPPLRKPTLPLKTEDERRSTLPSIDTWRSREKQPSLLRPRSTSTRDEEEKPAKQPKLIVRMPLKKTGPNALQKPLLEKATRAPPMHAPPKHLLEKPTRAPPMHAPPKYLLEKHKMTEFAEDETIQKLPLASMLRLRSPKSGPCRPVPKVKAAVARGSSAGSSSQSQEFESTARSSSQPHVFEELPQQKATNANVEHEQTDAKEIWMSKCGAELLLAGTAEECVRAFHHMLEFHDPEETGVSMIWAIRNLVFAANEKLADDADELRQLLELLRGIPWFLENQQRVKWQDSKNRINLSKVNHKNPDDIVAWERARLGYTPGDKGKGKQRGRRGGRRHTRVSEEDL